MSAKRPREELFDSLGDGLYVERADAHRPGWDALPFPATSVGGDLGGVSALGGGESARGDEGVLGGESVVGGGSAHGAAARAAFLDGEDADEGHADDEENGGGSADEDELLDEFFGDDEDEAELGACDPEEWIRRHRAAHTSPDEILAQLGLRVRHAASQDEMWELVAQLVAQFRERMLPRRRLPAFSTIEHAVGLVQRARRIVVLSGAGISVSAGIPDFRSKHGVYQLVEERFDLPDPQSLFDIHYFVDDPVPFFTFAKNLYPGTYSPTPAHYFIRALEQREKLLCNYTQNIDTLEKVAGIERKVTCHGSFETASCLACKHTVPCDEIHTDIVAGRVPTCPRCTHELNILKPDIVFFGEPLGEGFERHIQDDLPQCDLLVVMGSSMRVQPVATIPSMLARDVPQILINRELVMSPHQFDVELLGNCDAIVHELCDRLGWQLPVGPSAAATSAPAGGRPSAEHVAGAPGAPSAAPPTGVGSGSAAGAPAAPAAAGGSAAAPGRFEFEPPNRYLFEGAVRPSMPIPPSPAGAGAPAASPAGPDPPVPEAEAQRGQPAAMPAADAAAGGGAGALGDATAAVAPAEVGVPNAAEDVSPVPAASVLLEAGV